MVSGHLQQKKGNWYIILNLHDETGKRAPKWIATHLTVQGNKRRAEEMLLQARQQYTDIYGKPGPSGPLFADYMLQWLARMKGKVSPTTYRNYKYVIENSICPYFRERGIPLRGLRAIDLEEYYAYLQEQGVSPNTAIHHHANIHKALKDAVRLDLVDRNVAEIADRPQKQKYLPAHYSASEVNQLLDKLRGHWMYVPVVLSVFYGLRRSEVLGLQWGSVDFENNWESSSTAELDFVLQKGNQIIGIEVKKGEHVRSRSLGVFADSYKPAYSIRLSLKNFGEKDGLKSVPLIR